VHIVTSDESHVTIFTALRLLGLGGATAVRVPTDGQGRLRADKIAAALAQCDGPTIVCAQAGNVNTGSFDPLTEVVAAAHARGAWVHVDGAFGLWGAVSQALASQLAGCAGADSWATDAHKWLNVPYDSGVAIVADGAALHATMTADASYLIKTAGETRDPEDWVPEFSRRARGFSIYAALRSLGRSGVREMIERCCFLARRIAERLRAAPGGKVEILNDVVLNQVLARFTPASGGDADAFTREVVQRVQADGTCWLSGTTWHGRAAMRISVSNWSTSDADADASADAILRTATRA
jgi:glutamate/tyrosine decarboxylase-like PLP-dependent enzyme